MAIANEQLRQIITENNITSVGDIYALSKDSFNDMLQELLKQRRMHLLPMLKMKREI